MTVRKKLLVSGVVQGVFFRDSARRIASAKQVAGSARNLPDGRVEIVLEGSRDAVADVVAWAKDGPDHAHVESIEVIDQEPQGLSGFTID